MQEPIEPRRPTVLDPTRAKPEPWFVGSGKGLRIGVLALCALLIVLRITSTIWLAEDGWRWWQDARAKVEQQARGFPEDATIEALPYGKIPAPDPGKANRGLRGNPAIAFSEHSYPPLSIANGEEGRTVVHLDIDARGAPTLCRVKRSSGYKRLDDRTCEVAIKRVRFDPARDAGGRARTSTYTLPVRWVLPGR